MGSWIESFVDYTANTEGAPIFRRWAAISTIAAVLEQKVFIQTTAPLYPNLYVFLVGRAGIGKSRTISAALEFVRELPEIHLGPTSMTAAVLVDHLVEAKRQIVQLPDPMIEYNSLYLAPDELTAFMHEYEAQIIAELTTFYDVQPYSQSRRVGDIRIKIAKPQINLITGVTPSNLLRILPEFAWEQGFSSRVILIYSEDRPMVDVLGSTRSLRPADMLHDLKVINGLTGGFAWTKEFHKSTNDWRLLEKDHAPQHPKLAHYNARRFAHFLKLCMVACVDRGNSMELNLEDFNRASQWLLEAEIHMPRVFEIGSASRDSQAMDEIVHFIKKYPKGISDQHVMRFARDKIPAREVEKVIEVMVRSGMLLVKSTDPITRIRVLIHADL